MALYKPLCQKVLLVIRLFSNGGACTDKCRPKELVTEATWDVTSSWSSMRRPL